MAMPKARLVVKVEKDSTMPQGVAIWVRDGEHGSYGPEYKVSLAMLKGAEVMRAAANVGAAQTHGSTSDQRIAAIVAKVNAPDYTPNVFTPKPKKERENDLITAPAPLGTPAPVSTPTPLGTPTPVASLPESGSYTPTPASTTPVPVAPVASPVTPAPVIAQDDAASKLGEALAALMPPAIDAEALKAEVVAAATEATNRILSQAEVVTIVISDPLRNLDSELPKLHHAILPEVIQAVGAGVNVFLTGPAGSGKTTIAAQCAEALGKTFYADSFTDDMMRASLVGYEDALGKRHDSELRLAYESARDPENASGSLYLADELDNARTSIGAGLNMALSNNRMRFCDTTLDVEYGMGGLSAIAGANTWGDGATAEYVGRFPIDAALKTRFPFRKFVTYDLTMERNAALQYATDASHAQVSEWIDYAQALRRRVDENKVHLLITPRELIAGAKLLSAGMTMGTVKMSTVLAGMTPAIARKLGVSEVQ